MQTFFEAVTDLNLRAALQALPKGVKVDTMAPDGSIPRYRIHIDNQTFFNLGANMHLLHGGVVIASLKHAPLVGQNQIQQFVKDALAKLQGGSKLAPKVQSYARKYLGQEKSAQVNSQGTQTTLVYDDITIRITGNHFVISGNKTGRAFVAKNYNDPSEIDDLFKSAAFYADSVRRGQLS